MARAYKSVNLTESQQTFIKALDEYEIDIFSISSVEELIDLQFDNLNEILENLVDKNFLTRIERGKYCRSTFKDENVIGCHLVSDGAVAYWSAMNLHGLTEQFPNTIFIQTTKLKPEKIILGVLYKFVKVIPGKRIGIVTKGFGNHQFNITGIEKTIVDCFDMPEYSGGYAELIRAFSNAELNETSLIESCTAINNISVIKRIGYLAELLNKDGLSNFIVFGKKRVKNKYSLFDPQGNDNGEFVNEWKLRLNISREQLLDICNKQY